MATGWRDWHDDELREWLRVPVAGDDKYSRGVLGVLTGSDMYPGAAVLGVEAAARTGAGMVRYVGDDRPSDLILQRRPEVVTASGRVQAWLIGSGMDASERSEGETRQIRAALRQGLPTVLDAGALDLVASSGGPTLLTPHAGELVRVLSDLGEKPTRGEVEADPERWSRRAADGTGATVLLKGATTHIVAPDGEGLRVRAGSPWLATAGSGDVLGGILGALLAAHSDAILDDTSELVVVAAAGARLHGLAGDLAADGAPLVALDIAEKIPAAFRAALHASPTDERS